MARFNLKGILIASTIVPVGVAVMGGLTGGSAPFRLVIGGIIICTGLGLLFEQGLLGAVVGAWAGGVLMVIIYAIIYFAFPDNPAMQLF